MNHIFNVIFDKIRNEFIVVSELTFRRRKTKSSKNKITPPQAKIATFSILVSSIAIPQHAFAWQNIVTFKENNGTNIRVDNSVRNCASNNPSNSVIMNPASGTESVTCESVQNNSVLIGINSKATGTSGQDNSGQTVVGYSSVGLGQQATIVGTRSGAMGQSTAIGNDVFANGVSSIAIGSDDLILEDTTKKYGDKLPAETIDTIFAGLKSATTYWAAQNGMTFDAKYKQKSEYSPTYAAQLGAIAIGSRAIAGGEVSTSVGSLSFALADRSTAMGVRTFVSQDAIGGTAIGEQSRVFAANSIAIGNFTEASAQGSFAYGYNAKAVGQGSLAFGYDSAAGAQINTTQYDTLLSATRTLHQIEILNPDGSINKAAQVQFNQGVQTLINGDSQGKGGVATMFSDESLFEKDTSKEYLNIGGKSVYKTAVSKETYQGKGDAENAFAMGRYAFALRSNAMAFGYATIADAKSSLAIGSFAHTDVTAENSIAFGINTYAGGRNNFVSGYSARSYGNDAMALGVGAYIGKSGENSTAIGKLAKVDSNLQNPVKDAMAIGNYSVVTLNNSVALGVNSKTDYNPQNLEQAGWVSKGAIAIPTSVATGLISVGSINNERRIVNVASGYADSDAVNVAQLRTVDERIDNILNSLADNGGLQYLAVDKTHSDGDAGKLAAKLKTVQDYQQYINLQKLIIGFEAREQLNGEEINDANLQVMRDRATQLNANNRFDNLTQDLNTLREQLQKETKTKDKQKYEEYLNKLTTAYNTAANTLPDGLTPEEIATLKQNTNYDNDGAKGADSIALGYQAATAQNANAAIAIGKQSQSNAKQAIAIGVNNSVAGENSVALGSNNHITADNVLVLGSNNTTANLANSVYLGTGSSQVTTASRPLGTSYATVKIGSLEFSHFAGNNPTSIVTIGSNSLSRLLQGVAAGTISENSTDAVNGSQLYATNLMLERSANSLKTLLGNVVTLNKDGSLTLQNQQTFGGIANAVTLHDALSAKMTFIADSGINPSKKLGESLTIKGGATIKEQNNATLAPTNIEVIGGSDGLAIRLKPMITGLTEVQTDQLKTNQIQLGMTDSSPKISSDGNHIQVNNSKITQLAAGEISTNSTDAINGGQLRTLLGVDNGAKIGGTSKTDISGAIEELKNSIITSPTVGLQELKLKSADTETALNLKTDTLVFEATEKQTQVSLKQDNAQKIVQIALAKQIEQIESITLNHVSNMPSLQINQNGLSLLNAANTPLASLNLTKTKIQLSGESHQAITLSGIKASTEQLDAVNYGLLKTMTGQVIYTDQNGNAVAQANDGKWYKINDLTLNPDGTYQTQNQQPIENAPILSFVGEDGKTTTPITIANLKANLQAKDPSAEEIAAAEAIAKASNEGKELTAEQKAAVKEALQSQQINQLINTLLLNNDQRQLSRAATLSDLQVIAKAGLTFIGNDHNEIHRTLGTTIAIEGQKAAQYDENSYTADNLITHNDNGVLRIEMKKNPQFNTITLQQDQVRRELSVNTDGNLIIKDPDKNSTVVTNQNINYIGELSYQANNGKKHHVSLEKGLNVNGDQNVKINAGDNGDINLQLAKDLKDIQSIENGKTKISLDEQNNQINVNGATLTGLADGVKDNDAVTVKQLKQINHDITDTKNQVEKGFNIATQNGSTQSQANLKLGDTIKIEAGSHVEISEIKKEDDNIFSYTINVKGIPMTYVDKDGKPLVQVGDEFYHLQANGAIDLTSSAAPAGVKVVKNPAQLNNQKIENSQLSTVEVANAKIQQSSQQAVTGGQIADLLGKDYDSQSGKVTKKNADGSTQIDTAGIGNTGKHTINEAIDSISVKGGKNIQVTQNNLNQKQFTVSLKENITVNSIQIGNVKINTQRDAKYHQQNDNVLNVKGTNGKETIIAGVADGKAPTDAVNVRQLIATTQSTNNAVHHLNRRINQLSKESRAGIAGAMATAGLQQVNQAGKTSISVGSAVFKGESAVALGLSKLSDSGHIGVRLTGMTTSNGDTGGSVSVGYSW